MEIYKEHLKTGTGKPLRIYFGNFDGNIGTTYVSNIVLDRIKKYLKTQQNVISNDTKTYTKYKYFDKNLLICLDNDQRTYFSESIDFVEKYDNMCVGIVDRKIIDEDNFPIISQYHHITTYKLETIRYIGVIISVFSYSDTNEISIDIEHSKLNEGFQLANNIVKLFK